MLFYLFPEEKLALQKESVLEYKLTKALQKHLSGIDPSLWHDKLYEILRWDMLIYVCMSYMYVIFILVLLILCFIRYTARYIILLLDYSHIYT